MPVIETGREGAVLSVPVNPFTTGDTHLGAVPIVIDRLGGLDGEVLSLSVDGSSARLLDEAGAPVDGPLSIATVPATVYVEGLSPGSATLHLAGGDCEAVALDVLVVPPPALAGRIRPEAPGFGVDRAFAAGTPVALALDPSVRPDLAGVPADAFVVPHRTLADWAADPALDPVTPPTPLLLSEAGALAGTVVWSAAEAGPDVLGARYDLVLDLDGDGALSPGDVADFGVDGEGAVWVVADLAAPGPHPTDTQDVSGGDWLGERVYWPTDIADLGPVPLVVISHGNGHDYTWYDYLGEHLASWGYVVMAHQNETNPGIETASETTLTNTDWFLAHLDEIGGGVLTGLVDGSRMAWIGHSRGGEGVVRAYARVHEGDYSPTGWTVDSVRVIASIAPTVFNEVTASDPYEVRYHVLSGSSDGDVTGGPDTPYTQYWRLSEAARGVTSTTYVYGASHEDFNCCGYDDGAGPDQLSRTDAQEIAKAWLLAVVAEGVGADPFAREVLTHDPAVLPATPVATPVLSTWHDPAALVIDDFQANTDPARASSGAAVSWRVDAYTEDRLDDADLLLEWTGEDPMNGMTQADLPSDHAAGAVFEWEAPGAVQWELPSDVADWSDYAVISVRACQGTRHPITVDWEDAVDFAITLVDSNGTTVTRAVTPYGAAVTPYQRGRLGEGKGWSNAFSTLRIPLADFVSGGTGLDLADIDVVRIEVGLDGLAPEGRLGIDDLEVSP